MSRTTPPRPVDITEHFPELTQFMATATRLHPRPGEPTAADSSVGGPLRWPAGEPWPVCAEGDAYPMNCAECGTAMVLLFTAASSEWHGGGGGWRPVDEPAEASPGPTHVSIGRGYALYVFRCPASFEHPAATAMQ